MSVHAADQSPEERAAYLASLDCVHCGMCLEQCPTYRVNGRESSNPRGRIYLMRGLLEQTLPATPAVTSELDACLVCRACESACPADVRFGELIAASRSTTRERGLLRRMAMGLMLGRTRLGFAATMTRLWQRTPLRRLRKFLPKELARMESYAPAIPPASERRRLPDFLPAIGERRGRVALFEGCIMSVVFQDVNRDTAELCRAAGFEVVVPRNQGCCGALHEHDGALEVARAQARSNAAAFSDPQIEALVLDSAGCSATLAGAEHLIGEEGKRLAGLVVDIGAFLRQHSEGLRWKACSESEGAVTYDAPCHLHHAQGDPIGPLPLIEAVPGVQLRPMAEADRCCGAAGIYNLEHPEMARTVLQEKLDALEATGARTLLTGNPGCMLQWRTGIAERGLSVEVLHPATWLVRHLDDSLRSPSER